jgi:hypothetical protein
MKITRDRTSVQIASQFCKIAASGALEPVNNGVVTGAYHSGGYAIAIYIAACAVVSLISAAFIPDYTGRDISMEYDN